MKRYLCIMALVAAAGCSQRQPVEEWQLPSPAEAKQIAPEAASVIAKAEALALAEKMPRLPFTLYGHINIGSPNYDHALACAIARAAGAVAFSLPMQRDPARVDWREVDEALAVQRETGCRLGMYVLHKQGSVWDEFDDLRDLLGLIDRVDVMVGRVKAAGGAISAVQLHIENNTKGTGSAWDGLTAEHYTRVYEVVKDVLPDALVFWYDYPGPGLGFYGWTTEKGHVPPGTKTDATSSSEYACDAAMIPWQATACRRTATDWTPFQPMATPGLLPWVPNITLTGSLAAMRRTRADGSTQLYGYAIDGNACSADELVAMGDRFSEFGVKFAFMWPDQMDHRVDLRRSLVAMQCIGEGGLRVTPTFTDADLWPTVRLEPALTPGDFDGDGDVDLYDFASFQRLIGGVR